MCVVQVMFRRFVDKHLFEIIVVYGALNSMFVASILARQREVKELKMAQQQTELNVEKMSSKFPFIPIGQVLFVASKMEDGSIYVQNGSGEFIPPPPT
jgi:hypothetical protein